MARGIDLFDCVLPTRNARNGQLFTAEGRINIKNARYAEDDRPLDRVMRLLHVPHLFTRVSPAPFHGRRNQRCDP